MTYTLSPPQQIGTHTIAILTEIRTSGKKGQDVAAFVAEKRPVFVLVQHGHNIIALDMHGSKVPPDTVLRLCPDAFAQLRGT